MKKILIGLLALVALMPATAQAHHWAYNANCGKAAYGLPCEPNLSDSEGVWAAVHVFNFEHPLAPWTKYKLPVYRVNRTARCVIVAHNYYDSARSDVILVNIDYQAGVPYVYKMVGWWGDEHPQVCFG